MKVMPPFLHSLRHFFEHHFGSPPADSQKPRIAHHALYRGFPDIPKAAVKLLAIIHDLIDEFAAQDLHHRHFLDAVEALPVQPGRVIDKLLCCLNLR